MNMTRLSLSVIALFELAPPVEVHIPFEVLRYGIVHVGERMPDGNPRWVGTGFVVDDRCMFLTAKHVLASVQDPERLVVRFQNPTLTSKVTTLNARVLHEDPTVDLAFLIIDKVGDAPCNSGSLHVFTIASNVPSVRSVGASVVVVGFPYLGGDVDIPVVRKGHLSSVEISMSSGPPVLLLDLHGVPGFSGSPVLLEHTGEVIGVVYGPGPTDRSFGFEWATPVTRNDYEVAKSKAGH